MTELLGRSRGARRARSGQLTTKSSRSTASSTCARAARPPPPHNRACSKIGSRRPCSGDVLNCGAANVILCCMSVPVATGIDLLEREELLGRLARELAESISGSGRFVFLAGEAGAGKTALVRVFGAEHAATVRLLSGACDALFTPRPLGPLADVAAEIGGDLEELVETGARPHEVLRALLEELRGPRPTLLVFEDVHWADEATLDVLRLLARRVATVPALVLATWRDEELDRAHPLRILIGELASSPAVTRLSLPPLTIEAVRTLSAPYPVDADELHRVTGGNPFFVTEVLAAGGARLPESVRDAVLARVSRLTPAARRLVDAVALVPPRVEPWLLEDIGGADSMEIDACLSSGVLCSEPGGIAFRHELARRAVEDAVPSIRRLDVHRTVLRGLTQDARAARDSARLAHHAEAAGDTAAVLAYAPAAAERATLLAAHREAAAQYARALRFAQELPAEARAELLERRSFACYLTDQFDEAIEALQEALVLYRELGDRLGEGAALCSLSRRLWCAGRKPQATAAVTEGVVVLEQLAPGRELAMAYSAMSSLCMNGEDREGTVVWGERAFELAEFLGETKAIVHTLNNIGTIELLDGIPDGREKLERSLALSVEAGLDADVGRAFINHAWAITRTRAYGDLEPIESGIEACGERGLEVWRLYMLAFRARSELDRGLWTEAAQTATSVLRYQRQAPLLRILALTVLGLVRARRGDPDQWAPFDEAIAAAGSSDELQFVAPVATARAEAAWLEGRHESVAKETEFALNLALRGGIGWVSGELALWRRRADIEESPPAKLAPPYAFALAGASADAAAWWGAAGCPYDAALALADAADLASLQQAHEQLVALGARPAATLVARRLRALGAVIPRGPRPSTRANPGELTVRELDVLRLISAGKRNADVADELVLSPRTVDHHVSAILRKLQVRTRGEAAAAALEFRLLQDR